MGDVADGQLGDDLLSVLHLVGSNPADCDGEELGVGVGVGCVEFWVSFLRWYTPHKLSGG